MSKLDNYNKLINAVEAKSKLGQRNNWRNFEIKVLSDSIEKSTGSNISHMTLRRIFTNKEGEELYIPNLSTLNILAQYIGFQSFSDFLKENEVDTPNETESINHDFSPIAPPSETANKNKKVPKRIKIYLALFLTAVVASLLTFLLLKPTSHPKIIGEQPITFLGAKFDSTLKTLEAEYIIDLRKAPKAKKYLMAFYNKHKTAYVVLEPQLRQVIRFSFPEQYNNVYTARLFLDDEIYDAYTYLTKPGQIKSEFIYDFKLNQVDLTSINLDSLNLNIDDKRIEYYLSKSDYFNLFSDEFTCELNADIIPAFTNKKHGTPGRIMLSLHFDCENLVFFLHPHKTISKKDTGTFCAFGMHELQLNGKPIDAPIYYNSNKPLNVKFGSHAGKFEVYVQDSLKANLPQQILNFGKLKYVSLFAIQFSELRINKFSVYDDVLTHSLIPE